MKISSILFIYVLISHSTFSQSQKYVCPVIDSKAIVEGLNSNEDGGTPSKVLRIECNECDIYSCSNGTVKKIDTVEKLLVVDIALGECIFSYYNLGSIKIVKGQEIKAGQKLGKLKKEKVFSLIITTSWGDVINASELIDCKFVNNQKVQ